MIERECSCGHRTRGTALAGAIAPVQYGPRIAGDRLLHAGQFLSKDRTALTLAELFGIPLSPGTVAWSSRPPPAAFRLPEDSLGDRLATISELSDHDRDLVLSFSGALVTEGWLKILAGGIS